MACPTRFHDIVIMKVQHATFIEENTVTQWFELLVGRHHAPSEPPPWHLYRHHHRTHGVADTFPLARPNTTVELSPNQLGIMLAIIESCLQLNTAVNLSQM